MNCFWKVLAHILHMLKTWFGFYKLKRAEKSQKRLETLFYFFSCKKALGCKHSIHVNIYFFCKQLHVFVFISNSILHFSLSCLQQNYDFCLKVAKKLLSATVKFSKISAWHLPLKGVYFMTSFADIILLVAQKLNQSESIFYLNIVIY